MHTSCRQGLNMTMGKLGCIFFTLSLFGTLVAFSTGPPNTAEVCQHMFPGHGVNAQMSTPPFEIKLSRKTYVRGGEKIGVSLKALHGYFIGGFLMQARRAGDCRSCDQKKAVGTFELLPNEKYLKTIACNSVLNSAIGHKTNRTLDMAVFNWVAPESPLGHINLVATVVKQKTKFWTTLYSDVILFQKSAVQPEVCPARILLNTNDTTTCPTSAAIRVCMNNLHWIILALVFGIYVYEF